MMVGCASGPYGFGAGWLFPFKGSKYKMAAKFGQKIISVTKSTDGPFLSVIQTCQTKAFLTLRLFITNYDVNS